MPFWNIKNAIEKSIQKIKGACNLLPKKKSEFKNFPHPQKVNTVNEPAVCKLAPTSH